ncbi:hypothetical protein TWF281_010374 [Arthrobotrys megalospora]
MKPKSPLSANFFTLPSILIFFLNLTPSVSPDPTNLNPHQLKDFIVIEKKDLELWESSNQAAFWKVNAAMIEFTETRTVLCPIGSDPALSSDNNYPNLDEEAADPRFTLSYLASVFKIVTRNLNFRIRTMYTPNLDGQESDTIRNFRKEFRWPAEKTEEMLKSIYDAISSYSEKLLIAWEQYDAWGARLFNENSARFLMSKTPLAYSTDPDEAIAWHVHEIAMWAVGGILPGSNNDTIMIPRARIGFRKDWAKLRSNLLNNPVTEATTWVDWSKELKLGLPVYTDLMRPGVYFPKTDEGLEDPQSVDWDPLRLDFTVTNLFEGVWEWCGCWAGSWYNVVEAIRQITPLPGLENLGLDPVTPLTLVDRVTNEEIAQLRSLLDLGISRLDTQNTNPNPIKFEAERAGVVNGGEGEAFRQRKDEKWRYGKDNFGQEDFEQWDLRQRRLQTENFQQQRSENGFEEEKIESQGTYFQPQLTADSAPLTGSDMEEES